MCLQKNNFWWCRCIISVFSFPHSLSLGYMYVQYTYLAIIWQTLLLHLSAGCFWGLRSLASPWLVLWPAPAHACNAVCNEKSKQGTALRHDRNLFPLEGASWQKKKKKRQKKEKSKRRQRCVQKERSLGLERKTNVIVHWLSLCQPSLNYWFLVSLLAPLPCPLYVFSGGRWHSSEWAPVVPPSACTAEDCVISSESGGACREAGSWSSMRSSLWMGEAGSWGVNTEKKNKIAKNSGKMQRNEENKLH